MDRELNRQKLDRAKRMLDVIGDGIPRQMIKLANAELSNKEFERRFNLFRKASKRILDAVKQLNDEVKADLDSYVSEARDFTEHKSDYMRSARSHRRLD